MTVQKGPALCEEYLIVEEGSLGVCHMMLPCARSHRHATAEEIAAWHESVESRIAELTNRYKKLLEEESK